MAVLMALFSLMNFGLWLLQTLFWGRRIARTQLQGDPIFVIGHWRSGTTLLHELLVLDERHTYSNTYDCFCPNHFLLTAPVFRPLLERIAAEAAADGQHGRGLGLPARRRIRPVQHGHAVAVLDDRLSQPPAAEPGVFRARGRVAASAGTVAKRTDVVSQVSHGANAAADRLEVAAAHLPHQGLAGDVPQGPLHPHRPQSAGDLPLDDQPLEAVVSKRRFAGADLRRAG